MCGVGGVGLMVLVRECVGRGGVLEEMCGLGVKMRAA
jgi:hypothetical protein